DKVHNDDLTGASQGPKHRPLNDWAFDGLHTLTTMQLNNSCFQWSLLDGVPPRADLSSNELTPTEVAATNSAGPPITTVSGEVRPGCGTHWVAPGQPGQVPVAIYGSPTFHVSAIVQTT